MYEPACPATGAVGSVKGKHAASPAVVTDSPLHRLIFLDGGFGELLAEFQNGLQLGRRCFDKLRHDLLAESVPDAGGVYLVPAFTGLGAPYWDMYARGCIVGVTRGTTRAHIARAVLEAIAFEVTDLMNAMRQDAGCEITVLRVDGGASVSDVMLRFQSDLLRIPVDRPKMVETTAFGAAALAGLAVGFWQSMDEVRALRVSDRVFSPERAQAECDEKYRLWKRAVSCACGWIEKA